MCRVRFCRVFFIKKTPPRRKTTALLVQNIPKGRDHISCHLWILSAHPTALPPGPYISQVLQNCKLVKVFRALLSREQHWKQPKGVSLEDLLNKSCYIHIRKYYDAIKVGLGGGRKPSLELWGKSPGYIVS